VIAFMVRARSRLSSRSVARSGEHDGHRRATHQPALSARFAITVALGLRFSRVVLMGSVIIIPARRAMYAAHDLRSMQSSPLRLRWRQRSRLALAPRLHVAVGPLVITIGPYLLAS